jgi:hypothetical protein
VKNLNRKPWAAALTFAAICIICGAWALVRSDKSSDADSPPAGKNLLRGSLPVQAGQLQSMKWEDIAPTIEGLVSSDCTPDTLLALANGMTNAPATYFRALLLLSQNKLESALALMESIDQKQLPAGHLYAPYRLHALLRPTIPNPYIADLKAARDQRNLPELAEARLNAQQGAAADALKAYMRSDPRDWTGHDVELLTGMLRHAGVGGDTRSMVSAAVRGRRMDPKVKAELSALVAGRQRGADATGILQTNLLEYLKRDSAARDIAISAATNQLQFRQRFARGEHQALLAEHKLSHPVNMPEETVLLLTLAAASERSALDLDRWSHELKRRNPSPEVASWIQEIKRAAR